MKHKLLVIKLNLKNGTKTLIEIVEEGTGGSIFIPDVGFFGHLQISSLILEAIYIGDGTQLGLVGTGVSMDKMIYSTQDNDNQTKSLTWVRELVSQIFIKILA